MNIANISNQAPKGKQSIKTAFKSLKTLCICCSSSSLSSSTLTEHLDAVDSEQATTTKYSTQKPLDKRAAVSNKQLSGRQYSSRYYKEAQADSTDSTGEDLDQFRPQSINQNTNVEDKKSPIKMDPSPVETSEENPIGGVSEEDGHETIVDQQPQPVPNDTNVYTHKLIITDRIDVPSSTNGDDQDELKFNLNEKRIFYRLELNRAIWEIPQRYEDVKPVGAGSYGLVSSATDNRKQMKVAIKKLARPFQSPIHAKRTYRELTLLAHMKHENVIGLLDVFSPCKSFLEFNDVYLVTHLMGADLGGIIKTQRLSDDHIQFLIYQILRGLKYIHSAGIIHRDLKPSNIAVNEDCELKVLDFGLARHTEAEMTGYVATRWYRAPEIMLNWMRYNQTVDIWSVGCIMAELITSRTLFPGKDHIDQLLRIMTLCGTPDAEFMKKITSEEARNYVRTLPVMKRKNFSEIFAGANPQAIDLLDQMLKLDSDLRPTAEQALAHPYLAQYADPSDEPTASSLYDESFEDQDRTVADWKRLIWREIVGFKLANPD